VIKDAIVYPRFSKGCLHLYLLNRCLSTLELWVWLCQWLSDVPAESKMLIGQTAPFINQWMGKVQFLLVYSQRIYISCFLVVCKIQNNRLFQAKW